MSAVVSNARQPPARDQYENTINHGLSTIYNQGKVSIYPSRRYRKTYREEDVRPDRQRQGEDDRPVLVSADAPRGGHERQGKDDHHDDERAADREHEPETLEDLGDLEPEVRALDLFLRRLPYDVVREQVCEEGVREMDREAAEEEETDRARCQ